MISGKPVRCGESEALVLRSYLFVSSLAAAWPWPWSDLCDKSCLWCVQRQRLMTAASCNNRKEEGRLRRTPGHFCAAFTPFSRSPSSTPPPHGQPPPQTQQDGVQEHPRFLPGKSCFSAPPFPSPFLLYAPGRVCAVVRERGSPSHDPQATPRAHARTYGMRTKARASPPGSVHCHSCVSLSLQLTKHLKHQHSHETHSTHIHRKS